MGERSTCRAMVSQSRAAAAMGYTEISGQAGRWGNANWRAVPGKREKVKGCLQDQEQEQPLEMGKDTSASSTKTFRKPIDRKALG